MDPAGGAYDAPPNLLVDTPSTFPSPSTPSASQTRRVRRLASQPPPQQILATPMFWWIKDCQNLSCLDRQLWQNPKFESFENWFVDLVAHVWLEQVLAVDTESEQFIVRCFSPPRQHKTVATPVRLVEWRQITGVFLDCLRSPTKRLQKHSTRDGGIKWKKSANYASHFLHHII